MLPQEHLLNMCLCKGNGQSDLSFDGSNGPTIRSYAHMDLKDLRAWLMMCIRYVYNDYPGMVCVHRESTNHETTLAVGSTT
jgi:hypothetical protein